MPLQRRLPKRGFKSRIGRLVDEIRLHELAGLATETIDLAVLREANLITGQVQQVKVILSGKLERVVHLRGIGATRGARAAIEAAGGTVED